MTKFNAGVARRVARACGAELEPPGAGEGLAEGEANLCVAPPGMGSPSTIDEVVQLLDVLPEPVSVPCLVQALDRPLAINSTSGIVSAQPAESVHNPRIFIFTDGLALSIVPAGRGRDLLELGQYDTPEESLKGELHMPVDTPVTKDAGVQATGVRIGLARGGSCRAPGVRCDGGPGALRHLQRALRSWARGASRLR